MAIAFHHFTLIFTWSTIMLNKKAIEKLRKKTKEEIKTTRYYKTLTKIMYKSPLGYVKYDDALIDVATVQAEINEPGLLSNFNATARQKHLNQLNHYSEIGNITTLRPYWLSNDLVEAFKISKPPNNLCLKTGSLNGLMFLPKSQAITLKLNGVNDFSEKISWFYYSLTPDRFCSVIVTYLSTGFSTIKRTFLSSIEEDEATPPVSYIYSPTGKRLLEKEENALNPNENSLDNVTNKLRNIAVQALLYIENYQPQLLLENKNVATKELIYKNHCQILPSNGLIVGANYKLKRENNYNFSNDKKSSHSIMTHWRSGHWRNQFYGNKNNRTHKTIWIEPMLINSP
jgi:hypothetical protein